MNSLSTNWDAISAVGGTLSALAGAASAIFAFMTVKKAKSASREQGELLERLAKFTADSNQATSRDHLANETYDRYLTLCINHPELAAYDVAAKAYGFLSPQDAWGKESPDTERYFWFLSYALNAFERILLDGGGNDPSWRAAIREQLQYHRPALVFLWTTDFRTHYATELAKEVEIVLAESSRKVSAGA